MVYGITCEFQATDSITKFLEKIKMSSDNLVECDNPTVSLKKIYNKLEEKRFLFNNNCYLVKEVFRLETSTLSLELTSKGTNYYLTPQMFDTIFSFGINRILKETVPGKFIFDGIKLHLGISTFSVELDDSEGVNFLLIDDITFEEFFINLDMLRLLLDENTVENPPLLLKDKSSSYQEELGALNIYDFPGNEQAIFKFKNKYYAVDNFKKNGDVTLRSWDLLFNEEYTIPYNIFRHMDSSCLDTETKFAISLKDICLAHAAHPEYEADIQSIDLQRDLVKMIVNDSIRGYKWVSDKNLASFISSGLNYLNCSQRCEMSYLDGVSKKYLLSYFNTQDNVSFFTYYSSEKVGDSGVYENVILPYNAVSLSNENLAYSRSYIEDLKLMLKSLKKDITFKKGRYLFNNFSYEDGIISFDQSNDGFYDNYSIEDEECNLCLFSSYFFSKISEDKLEGLLKKLDIKR